MPEEPRLCRIKGDAIAIIGGKEALFGSPFSRQVALVEMIGARGGRCSGTFIERDIVLTAAHCLVDPSYWRIEVSLETDKSHVMFVTTGVAHIINRSYLSSESTSTDLALIRTRDPLPKGFDPVALPSRTYPAGSTVAVAGYGLHVSAFNPLEVAEADHASILKYVELTLLTDSSASEIHTPLSVTAGISSGDSGGPMFAWNGVATEQIGLSSNATDEGHANFAPVSANRAWIARAIAKLHAKP